MNFNSELLTLLKNVGEGYESRIATLAKSAGLNALEGKILSFLRYNEGLDAPSDIVRLLSLSKGDVSIAVSHLEKKGYLNKTKDPSDQRKSHLHLRPEAEPLLKEIDAMRKDYFACLFKGFTPEEIASVKSLIERMNQNVHANE
jgi:DNA-binding MarR family transcriptional regulator